MKKSVFIIILSIVIMSFSFVAFAYTYDDLKDIFVTRDDVLNWESSMKSTLNGLENAKQHLIQNEVGYQMYRRGIKLPTEDETATINPSLMTEWSIRRSKELESIHGGAGPFFGSPAPAETNFTSSAKKKSSPSNASPSNVK